MSGPMVIIAVCYGTGLLLARAIPLSWAWIMGGAWGLALLTVCWERARFYLLWPLLILVGWANLAWRTSVLDPRDLRNVIGGKTLLTTVRGRLYQTPEVRIHQRSGEMRLRSLGQIDVIALRLENQWQPARGRIVFSHPDLLDVCFYTGMPVEVTGVIAPPPQAPAPGLFDYQRYLRWLGIYYQIQTERTNDWAVWSGLPTPACPPLSARFLAWSKSTLARGLPEEDESLRLIWAMALGWKTALTDEVSLPFMRTGTMHIFAISGMHIALMAGIVISLLRALHISRGSCGWLVIPMIWFYTMATGWQSSAIRSSLMMSVVIGGWSLRRPGNLLNSLAASALLLLIWEPQQLFQASFQLSFFVVLSLGLFYPIIRNYRDRWLQPDPLIPKDLYSVWWQRRRRLFQLATDGLVTSVASWIGSAPIIAYYFHLVTPISLLTNLLIVPLSSLTLACNLGSVLCGQWLGSLTSLFNSSAWLWMRWTVDLCDWFAKLPGSYYYLRTPNPAEIASFYLLISLVAFGRKWKPPLRWAILILLACLMAWDVNNLWQNRRNVTITLLSVLGGESIFVDAPGTRSDLLVDCGNASTAGYVVTPFLHAQGLNRLAQCLVTHGDAQHMAGLPTLLESFPTALCLTSPIQFRSKVHQTVFSNLSTQGIAVAWICQDDSVAGWRVLHPQAMDRFTLADDASLVLETHWQGVQILICPDLGEAGQKLLLERNRHLKSDIIISSWPSRGEPVLESLLEVCQPRLVVMNGLAPHGKSPLREKVRRRLSQRSIELLEIETPGSLSIALKSGQWKISAWPRTEPQLRSQGSTAP